MVWCWTHPAEVSLAWPIFTGLLSIAYREADATTRGHALIMLALRAGLDIPGATAWLYRILMSPPRPPPAPPSPQTEPDPMTSDTRNPPVSRLVAYQRKSSPAGVIERLGVAVGVLACYACGMLLAACASWFTPAHVTDVTDGLRVAACIMDHITEPPDAIVRDCEGATAQMVVDILSAQERAERARARARGWRVLDGGQ